MTREGTAVGLADGVGRRRGSLWNILIFGVKQEGCPLRVRVGRGAGSLRGDVNQALKGTESREPGGHQSHCSSIK